MLIQAINFASNSVITLQYYSVFHQEKKLRPFKLATRVNQQKILLSTNTAEEFDLVKSSFCIVNGTFHDFQSDKQFSPVTRHIRQTKSWPNWLREEKMLCRVLLPHCPSSWNSHSKEFTTWCRLCKQWKIIRQPWQELPLEAVDAMNWVGQKSKALVCIDAYINTLMYISAQ